MFNPKAIASKVDADGYAIQEGILTESVIGKLIDAIERHQDGQSLLRNGRIFAVRNLLDLPEISELAETVEVRELAEAVLGANAFAVRGILFDKVP